MKTDEQVFEEIKTLGYITEQQVDLLKTTGNNENRWIFFDLLDTEQFKEGIPLTLEHGEKELSFLHDLAYTPRGSIKSDCPFGPRELDTINNNTGFTFQGFINVGNRDSVKLIPVYKTGNMEYYYDGNIYIVY